MQTRLQEAAARLDEHAAARRLKALGPQLVDVHDLPVSAAYVDGVEACGARVVHASRWLNAISVWATEAQQSRIEAMEFVDRITPVAHGRSVRHRASDAPGEPGGQSGPGTRDAFDYGPSRDQLAEIGVLPLHDIGLSGAGVRVAMFDTGYFREHPAFEQLLLDGRLIDQWDFVNGDEETQDETGDPEGQHNHGTTTWSLVGGFTEGELVAPAYGAEFLLAKTEDTSLEDPIEEDNWVAAVEWADTNGADIISSSLAYIDWYTYEDLDGDTAVVTVGADMAASRGILVCTAAGNYGTQDWYYIGPPADADSVMAVGATEPNGDMWLDSSHGPTYDGRIKPEVCARGSLTYAASIPGGHGGPDEFRHFDGTSVSTPLVAGCAALLMEAHPGWSAMQVREALMMTADLASAPDNHRGWGRIDVSAALTYGMSLVDGRDAESEGGWLSSGPALTLEVFPNPFSGAVRFAWPPNELGSGAAAGGVLEICSVTGRRVGEYVFETGAYTAEWDGRDQSGHSVPSGVYFVRLSLGHAVVRSTVLRID